jgi:hypothetical protein
MSPFHLCGDVFTALFQQATLWNFPKISVLIEFPKFSAKIVVKQKQTTADCQKNQQ